MSNPPKSRRIITLGYDEFDETTWRRFKVLLLERGLTIKDWVIKKVTEELAKDAKAK